jgi:hypothetical protein
MAFNVAATVTLCSYRNASPFWIMLWLVSGPADYGMILAGCSRLFRYVAWYDAQREWSFFGVLLAAFGCRATLALQHALITVWLQVRVLPGPPRTPTLIEISRGLTTTR